MSVLTTHRKQMMGGILCVLIAMALLVSVANSRTPPQVKETPDEGLPVEAMQVKPVTLAPAVVGYGHVRPQQLWEAIAEVSGKVVYKHPKLEAGERIEQGEVLLRIDPLEYELKLARALADLSSAQAELQGLDVKRQTLELNASIQRKQFELATRELERKETLFKRKLISRSTLDKERQNLLNQKLQVQELDNSLTILVNDRKVALAKIRLLEAQHAEAERALARTVITLPFEARIAEVNVEPEQVVNLQQRMVVAHSQQGVEVESQVSIHDMYRLISTLEADEITEAKVSRDLSVFDWQAELRLVGSEHLYRWPAEVTRLRESIDEKRGTAGVVVTVDKLNSEATDERRPPLLNGMFAQIRVIGASREVLAVPSQAVHGNDIYLVGTDSRLRIKPVQVLFSGSGWTAISTGLTQGDQVVLTDVVPLIEGTLLTVTDVEITP